MFKLHYASLDLGNNEVPCFEFKKHSQMVDFIDKKCINRNGKVVWLLAKKEFSDVFVSENHISIQDFLTKKSVWKTVGDYFLQEYLSFADAYTVALRISETNSPKSKSKKRCHDVPFSQVDTCMPNDIGTCETCESYY